MPTASKPLTEAALLKMRDNLPATGNGKPLDDRIRLGIFSLSILSLLVLAFYILPSAHILLYPKTERQEMTLDVRASTAVNQINITGLIPAYEDLVTVSGQKTSTSSGLVPVGIQKAAGEVLFRNLTVEEIVLPAGTIVSTAGENQNRFATITGVTLPPGNDSVAAEVEAVIPGLEGNIQPGQIAIVEGIFGSKTEASNPDAFSGGSSQNLAAPVTLDYTLIRYQLLDELENQAQAELALKSVSGKNVIEGSLVLSEVITEEKLNPINHPSDTLTLVMTVNYDYLYYDPAHLEDLVTRVMNISIPEGYHVAEGAPAEVNRGGELLHENGEASWTVNASREIIKDLELEKQLTEIKGKLKAEALEILNNNIPQLRSAEISTFVKWWPWLPLLTSRITLEEGSINDG